MVCTHSLQFHVKCQHPTTDYIALILLGFWISSLYCIQKWKHLQELHLLVFVGSRFCWHLLSLVQQNELFLLMGIICLLTILVSAPIIGFLSVGHSKHRPKRVVELYVSCYLKRNHTLGVYGYAVEYQYLWLIGSSLQMPESICFIKHLFCSKN